MNGMDSGTFYSVSKVDEGKREWKQLDVVEAMENNGKMSSII